MQVVNNKRRRRAFAAAVMAYGLLAGCGGENENEVPEINVETDEGSASHVLTSQVPVGNEEQLGAVVSQVLQELAFAHPENPERTTYDRTLTGGVVVNKAGSEIVLIDREGEQRRMPVLLGRAIKDYLVSGVSVFAQGVTPALGGHTLLVIYDPSLNPDQYAGQMMIAFSPFQKLPDGSVEVLAFHTVLNPDRDGLNVADGDPTNNRVSNGCIRLSYDDFEALLRFSLGDDYESFMQAVENNEYRGPLMASTRTLVAVLPEENTSIDYTLEITGMDFAPDRQ